MILWEVKVGLTKEQAQILLDDFVNEFYPYDFLWQLLDREINTDMLRSQLKEIMGSKMVEGYPYNQLPELYWREKARLVPTNRELARYTKYDLFEEFAEKYAPDWQEIAKENS